MPHDTSPPYYSGVPALSPVTYLAVDFMARVDTVAHTTSGWLVCCQNVTISCPTVPRMDFLTTTQLIILWWSSRFTAKFVYLHHAEILFAQRVVLALLAFIHQEEYRFSKRIYETHALTRVHSLSNRSLPSPSHHLILIPLLMHTQYIRYYKHGNSLSKSKPLSCQ